MFPIGVILKLLAGAGALYAIKKFNDSPVERNAATRAAEDSVELEDILFGPTTQDTKSTRPFSEQVDPLGWFGSLVVSCILVGAVIIAAHELLFAVLGEEYFFIITVVLLVHVKRSRVAWKFCSDTFHRIYDHYIWARDHIKHFFTSPGHPATGAQAI